MFDKSPKLLQMAAWAVLQFHIQYSNLSNDQYSSGDSNSLVDSQEFLQGVLP